MSTLARLRALGFDRARHIPFTRSYHVACSQCAAVAINGIAAHETGCQNARHECRGCTTLVSARVRYCEECGR